MNSFMFTFSANQPILQLSQCQKQQGCLLQTFRRRPTSSSMSKQDKSRKYSSNVNQLFEKSHHHDVNIQESPEKGISSLRIKNSSMQLQQKKKIRNMIDTMLGKNFQMQSNPKLDSIVFTNRKNLNKHRSYLTGTKKYQQQSKDFNENQYKQNHQNEQNTNNELNMQNVEMLEKTNKTKSKLKKFQFAAIKINKKSQHSHRYEMEEKQEEVEENHNKQFFKRKCVNVSRESIGKQSVDKKFTKTKTPKIMYPQSDSKLPFIFRANKHKNVAGQSLKKQKRVSSAHQLPEDSVIEEEQSITVRRKSTLENERMGNQVVRKFRFRPKSMKMQQKPHPNSQYESFSVNPPFPPQFHPTRLVFDSNNHQSIVSVKRRLVPQRSSSPTTKTIRIATRAQSTHCKYVFHKLQNINQTQHMNVFEQNEGDELIKNDSTRSKETAQESTFQSFTDASLQNVNDDLVDSLELRQYGLGCSVTFQIHKS